MSPWHLGSRRRQTGMQLLRFLLSQREELERRQVYSSGERLRIVLTCCSRLNHRMFASARGMVSCALLSCPEALQRRPSREAPFTLNSSLGKHMLSVISAGTPACAPRGRPESRQEVASVLASWPNEKAMLGRRVSLGQGAATTRLSRSRRAHRVRVAGTCNSFLQDSASFGTLNS